MSENRIVYSTRQQVRFGLISHEQYLATLSDRNADWRTKSPTEQLAALDRRLGKGIGAKRQRAKLAKALEPKPVEVKAEVPTPEQFASKSEEKRVKTLRKQAKRANREK